MTTIGDKIAELRKLKGFTQEQLGEIIGVSAQSVSKWENGTTMPDVMLLPIIADTFDMPIDFLFGRDSSNAQNINADKTLECACEALKKTIVSTGFGFDCNSTKSYDEQLKEYKSSLESDAQVRSVIIRNHGVVYYRENIGGLMLKKPKDGWATLLEDDDAAKIISLLNNRNFCKALSTIIKAKMTSFTISFLCHICKIAQTSELKEALLSSGFFEVKSVKIDENDIEIYDLKQSHRLFMIFAVLQYAKEFANYEDRCYYYFGDSNFLND